MPAPIVRSDSRRPLVDLLAFHWASSARVALRANAIVLGAVVCLIGSQPDGLASFRAFVLSIVARDRPVDARAMVAAFGVAFAATAVPRVTLGAAGWMRSLPVNGHTVWRAAVGAVWIAQLAVLAFMPVAALLATFVYHAPLSVAKLAAVPIMLAAVAMVALPVRPCRTRWLAGVAAAACVPGTWIGIVVAVVCLGLADVGAPHLSGGARRTRAGQRQIRAASPVMIWIRVSWRGMGVSTFVGGAFLPIVLGSFAYFITRNNVDLAPHTAATVVRVCGVLAVAPYAATLANVLLRTRQPWPWMRSLPWSCRLRVLADTAVIGLPLVLIPVGLVGAGFASAIAVAALVPFAAAIGAAAVRGGIGRQTGAAGECMVATLGAGALIALWPMTGLLVLAAAPLAVMLGEHRERTMVASQWSELHHAAGGDPAWLSGG